MAPDQATRTIIVAWDGSRSSATTFPLASILAAQLHARVEILHVLTPEASGEDARTTLRDIGTNGLDLADLRLEGGGVAQAILAAAEAPQVELVILTTHVTSIDEGRHLGGVAEAVAADSSKPVLLVRPEAPLAPRELQHLLLPVDGTPGTAWALAPATELAKRLGAAVDLLYVAGERSQAPAERGSIGAPRYVDQPQHEWPDWAGEVGERLAVCCASAPAEVRVQAFLAQGDISSEIEKFAIDHASDAIVLVRRSHLQPGRARTLRAVLERAPCPVLILSGPGD
jgi:nucleotide-binding universal stress UspA family protein